jgi:hypothetical protein
VCVYYLYKFVQNVSDYKENSARICHNYTYAFIYSGRHYSQLQLDLEFSRRFWKRTQKQNFMDIRLAGAELFHTDGRRDRYTVGQTDRQTDRLDAGNNRFAQYSCKRLKIIFIISV